MYHGKGGLTLFFSEKMLQALILFYPLWTKFNYFKSCFSSFEKVNNKMQTLFKKNYFWEAILMEGLGKVLSYSTGIAQPSLCPNGTSIFETSIIQC